MKTLHTIFISLATLFVLSCNKMDSELSIQEQGDCGITTLTVAPPVPATKVGITDDESVGLKLVWEVDDEITIYPSDDGFRIGNFKCTFTDPVTNKAIFTAVPGSGPYEADPILTNETPYRAVYPKSTYARYSIRDENKAIALALQSQSENSLEHLNNGLFMNSSFTADSGESLSFTYETSIISLTFPWIESVPPNSVSFNDGDNNYKLSHTSSFAKEDNDKYKVYFSILPNSGTRDLIITIENGVSDDTESFNRNNITKTYTAGSIYRSDIVEYEDKPRRYIDEYGIYHGKGILIDGVFWAPVNLGYRRNAHNSPDYPYGKLYQWGRKVGQGYYSVTTSDALEYGSSPEDDTFYRGASGARWSWLIESSSKSAFDGTTDWMDLAGFGPKVANPCPTGWRVPTSDELNALGENYSTWTQVEYDQAGYYFSGSAPYSKYVTSIFLPAAGLRNTSGIIESLNGAGRYWSSTPNSSTGFAKCFTFGSYFVGGEDDFAYAHGLSVRCVQD